MHIHIRVTLYIVEYQIPLLLFLPVPCYVLIVSTWVHFLELHKDLPSSAGASETKTIPVANKEQSISDNSKKMERPTRQVDFPSSYSWCREEGGAGVGGAAGLIAEGWSFLECTLIAIQKNGTLEMNWIGSKAIRSFSGITETGDERKDKANNNQLYPNYWRRII